MISLASNWKWSTVGEVGTVDLGRQRHPDWHVGPNMRPYLRVANVFEDRIDATDLKSMDFTGVFERYELKPGDVLLNEGQTPQLLGRPAIYSGYPEGVAFTNTILRFRAGEEVLPHWALLVFRHYMWSGRFTREARITTNIAHLSSSRFKSIEFPVPSLEEQRWITNLLEDHLSRLDAASQDLLNAEARVVGLRRAAQLRMILGGAHRAFATVGAAELGLPEPPHLQLPHGWAWRKWKEVGVSQNGRAFPSGDYSDTGVRLLRPGNLGPNGVLTWTDRSTRRLPEQYAANYRRLLIEPGDIVMNLTAQSLKDDFLGRVCMAEENDSALLNQRIARLRTSELLPEYAMRIFQSPVFRRYVKSLNAGSLIQHMFTKQVDEFWLPVPPRAYQEAAAAAATQHGQAEEHLLSGLRRSLDRAAVLRRALLAAAFSGHLTGHAFDLDRVEETVSV